MASRPLKPLHHRIARHRMERKAITAQLESRFVSNSPTRAELHAIAKNAGVDFDRVRREYTHLLLRGRIQPLPEHVPKKRPIPLLSPEQKVQRWKIMLAIAKHIRVHGNFERGAQTSIALKMGLKPHIIGNVKSILSTNGILQKWIRKYKRPH